MDVLCSMLVKEVLKVASSVASMSFLCLASISRRLVVALNVRSLIISMYSECTNSWARFWTGVVAVPRRTFAVWMLVRSMLLRLARVDMYRIGTGTVVGTCVGAVQSASSFTLLSLYV